MVSGLPPVAWEREVQEVGLEVPGATQWPLMKYLLTTAPWLPPRVQVVARAGALLANTNPGAGIRVPVVLEGFQVDLPIRGYRWVAMERGKVAAVAVEHLLRWVGAATRVLEEGSLEEHLGDDSHRRRQSHQNLASFRRSSSMGWTARG